MNWVTASEKENLGYDIMKSGDGVKFEKIGFVAGKGNSEIKNEYSYLDKNLKQNSYYQLVQHDANGRITKSQKVYISTRAFAGLDLVCPKSKRPDSASLQTDWNHWLSKW